MSKSKVFLNVLKIAADYALPLVLEACLEKNSFNDMAKDRFCSMQAPLPTVSSQPYYIMINNQVPPFMQNPWMNFMPQAATPWNQPYGQLPYQQPLMFSPSPYQYPVTPSVPQCQSMPISFGFPPKY